MTTTTEAIEKSTESYLQPIPINQMLSQVQAIQQLMGSVMKDGEHFGKIPGIDKDVLFKSGAEKLGFVFRLAPTFEIHQTDFPNNHREYRVVTTIKSITTGQIMGQGVGICSTMETKFRYVNDSDYELTGLPIPKDSQEKKREYRLQGYGMKKINGLWEWVKYKEEKKVERTDIADMFNTVLKMAKKRSHVDAIITATAASDIFTQDLDETLPTHDPKEVQEQPKTTSVQPQTAQQPTPNGKGQIPLMDEPTRKKINELVEDEFLTSQTKNRVVDWMNSGNNISQADALKAVTKLEAEIKAERSK